MFWSLCLVSHFTFSLLQCVRGEPSAGSDVKVQQKSAWERFSWQFVVEASAETFPEPQSAFPFMCTRQTAGLWRARAYSQGRSFACRETRSLPSSWASVHIKKNTEIRLNETSKALSLGGKKPFKASVKRFKIHEETRPRQPGHAWCVTDPYSALTARWRQMLNRTEEAAGQVSGGANGTSGADLQK